jgi:hypothetical protein
MEPRQHKRTALCRRHRHHHPRRVRRQLYPPRPTSGGGLCANVVKVEGRSQLPAATVETILVATHSNGLNAEGVLGFVTVDHLVRLGRITPRERHYVASDNNNGQTPPCQLKWLISSDGPAPGALTPVSDAFARTPGCRAAQ